MVYELPFSALTLNPPKASLPLKLRVVNPWNAGLLTVRDGAQGDCAIMGNLVYLGDRDFGRSLTGSERFVNCGSQRSACPCLQGSPQRLRIISRS